MNLAWIFSYCTFSEWSLSEKTSDDASEKGYEKTSGNKKNNE